MVRAGISLLPIEPEMLVIPGGEFQMGCATGASNERPVHRVSLSPFSIARTTVTNRMYEPFVLSTENEKPVGWDDSRFNHPDQPVTSVNWFEATAYCHWLSAQTGKPYRLPTEAEWECSARGGIETALYTWGDEDPHLQPDYSRLWLAGPERVGLRTPNGYGLHDISENVHEWCSDWFDEGYYAVSPVRNPTGPANGARRSSRGGSWRHQIKITRVAARSSIPPQFRYSDYGFRCAMDLQIP